jgi:hypothetical protein
MLQTAVCWGKLMNYLCVRGVAAPTPQVKIRDLGSRYSWQQIRGYRFFKIQDVGELMKQNKQSTFSNSAGAFVSRKKRTHLSVRLILCVPFHSS